MRDSIDQTMQKAQRYWQVDGLTELGFGLMIAFLGIYFYLEATLPQDTLLYNLMNGFFVVLIIGGSFGIGKIISFLKQHITYPRTGYITYKKKKGINRVAAGILAGAISMAVTSFILTAPGSLDWLPALSGVLFGMVLIFIAIRGASMRFFLLAVVSIATGLGFSVLGVGNYIGVAYYYFVMAGALFISGLGTLWVYLRTTSPAEIDEP